MYGKQLVCLQSLILCVFFNLIKIISEFPDVITIEKTGEHFRLIYDVKGRFTVHRIESAEAKVS